MLFLSGYKSLSCIHKGRSSNLYRAIRLSDELPVVIKVSAPKALTEKKIQLFRHEFEMGQRVDSPHVIRYLELKQDVTYGMAIVMEDYNAVELTSVVPPQGFSNYEFLEIAGQIVEGLQAIHAANIIHNDLKPSNILIQPTTKIIKIIDFNRASTSTMRQEIEMVPLKTIGALAYISPEQTGRVNRSVDYRSDFYSLGVMFYYLLCGQLPFTEKDSSKLIHQHLATQPPSLYLRKPTIALPLSEIVAKLLEKEAEKRYQSCEGILYDLNYCRSALEKTGTIPKFELRQQDFSKKLALSQHLYGRESEIDTLLKSFERISRGNREVVMISGEPGVGKSMFIQEIQKSITLKNGYFVTGKFDQLKKNLAYSALTQAFDNLIKQLLTEEDAIITHWKERLLTAVGHHVQLIIKVIPTLALLIGEQPTAVIEDINQAKNVFNLIFQEFINVCANAEHPLVIFLDDLQWTDDASMELMTYLMQQPKLTHLLWIGAYRDTDVTATHPAMQAVAALKDAQVNIQTLKLAPLDFENLRQWIADSLHMSIDKISSLAEVTQQKTAGNPFFVKTFLQALYDQRLLTFSSENQWQWELSAIRKHPATENVITLMAYQMRLLPEATQKGLSTASCLGHRISLSMLEIAMASSQDVICEVLQPAINSGILIQTETEIYFAHDRIQEAAYDLVEGKQRDDLHLLIGERLLKCLSTEESWLFDVVTQFNFCRPLITESQKRLQLACLNLKAGQKARQATAYAAALSYFHATQNWIDIKTLWLTDYPLAFTIHKELVEMEYVNGHIDAAQTLIADMQPHLQSVIDKADIYHLQIIQKTVLGQQQEAIAIGHQALQLLGGGLPLDNPGEFIKHEMPLLRQKLNKTSFSSLLDKPRIADPNIQAIFKILADLSSACYQIGSDLLPVTTIMSINLSLIHGHVPESCVGYVVYGLLLCTQFQEYALGYEFGNFAVKLAEKLGSPVQSCRSALFLYGFIYSWSKSIQELPAILNDTFEACIACGEIEYAGYHGNGKAHMLFDGGAQLQVVKQQIITNLQFTRSTKTESVIHNIMRGYQRVVANLMGETPNEEDFNYNGVDETKFESECQKSSNAMLLVLYYTHKAEALYLYGHFQKALQLLDSAKEKLACILGFHATAVFNMINSLSRLALYPTASPEDKSIYLQQIEKNQQQMQKWQASCMENFAHKYYLVEAELARIRGNYPKAEEHYEQAIELARKHGFIQEEALAAELAGKFWLLRDNPRCALGYLNTAFNGYKQWGARRKLALLEMHHADLFRVLAPPDLSQLVITTETTLSSNTLKLLDLSSILKASQTISSEIELPKLLRGMMQIIIENSGAQQGAVLFVEPNDTMLVQAEYTADGTITVLQNIPLDNWGNGAHAVIHYVKRLHQPVVVDNAITDEQFKMDPYISRTQTKSILCIPILQHLDHLTLKAILYVENNLMSYAFTSKRVQTVLILTAQMAISLENARYFSEQLALTRQLAEQSTRMRIAEESLHVMTHDFQLALQASSAGTWNWMIGTDHITWDATNCALFGLKPGEFKGTYAAVLECVHPEDRELLNQDIKRCIEQDIPHDMEYRVIWPDGSQHVIAAKGRIYRDEKGQPIKMMGVCLDVTQRKQLEQERLAAVEQAKEKEHQRAQEALAHQKKQEEFIDTVCHEIRNPLTGIYGNLEFLQQTVTSMKALKGTLPVDSQSSLEKYLSELEDSIQVISQCAKHQKVVIDDVLGLSKLEVGKVSLVIKPFQPKTLIEETLQVFTASLAAKHLTLQSVLPEHALTVKGDPDQFKIILMNLISNAVKYTEQGYIKVSLQMQPVTPSEIIITLSVEDTGIGLTKEQQMELFQRFSRPVSYQYEGSGLGLAIVKKIIDLMGGTIEVESEKGRGSRFTVRLSCESIAPEISISEKPELPQKPALLPVSKRILVVEDNIVNQKILQRVVQQLGYECVIADNGLEALKKCQKEAFDLILMDREMPIMDGINATKQIRSREKELKLVQTPIIGLSAYTRPELKEEGLAAGMNDYLTKPYEKEKLSNTIKKWTESQTELSAPTKISEDPPSLPVAETKKPILVKHTFVYQPSDVDFPVYSVHLASSFNDWLNPMDGRIKGELYPHWRMEREGTLWELTVLLPPGSYLFKYVINETIWRHDPKYRLSEDDYKNSILQIDPPKHEMRTPSAYLMRQTFMPSPSQTSKAEETEEEKKPEDPKAKDYAMMGPKG